MPDYARRIVSVGGTSVRRSGFAAGCVASLVIGTVGAASAGPPVSEPDSATEQSPAPIAPVGDPFTVVLATGEEPTLEGGHVLAPTALHPWIAIGEYRAAPGANRQLAVFTAEGPDAPWSLTASIGAHGLPSVASAVTTMPDGSALIVGRVATEDGWRPAWWHYDGSSLSEHSLIAPEVVAGLAGRANAVDVLDDGTWIAALDLQEASGGWGHRVVRRDLDGQWTSSEVEGILEASRLSAAGSRGATIVLSGGRELADGETIATVWASVDGGESFAMVDMRDFERDRLAGDVAVTADGFYAAVCEDGPRRTQHHYAFSADGITWERVGYTVGSGDLAIHPDECARLVVDEGGGVWQHSPLERNHDAFVYRIDGGRLSEAYQIVPEYPIDGPRGTPTFAVSETALGYLGAVNGGVLAGVAARESGSPSVPLQLSGGTGIPGFRQALDWSTPFERISADGTFVAVRTSPSVRRVEDTSGVVAERWGTRAYSQQLNAGGSLTEAVARFGVPPEDWVMVRHAAVGADEVALWGAIDPWDGTIAGSEHLGDVWISRRPAGGSWTPAEPLVQLPGTQEVNEVLSGGEYAVGVGIDRRQDGNGESSSTPLIVVIGPVAEFRIDVSSEEPFEAILDRICAGRDGTMLGFGDLGGDDAGAVVVRIDVAARAARSVTPGVDFERIAGCASEPDGTVVVAGTVDGSDHVYTTADGVEFTHVHELAGDDEVVDVHGGPAGVAVAGTAGGFGTETFVLFGASSAELQRVRVGPPTDEVGVAAVVVGEATVSVLGLRNAAGTVWQYSVG